MFRPPIKALGAPVDLAMVPFKLQTTYALPQPLTGRV